ncbi:MAG TPA: MTAP family purine nucleoside phosphorylase [Fimbriimonadaceae bacterium]|nr:MTAP family purine nucleoside phosphorylase [Fimbriimonadaceae bacterium]
MAGFGDRMKVDLAIIGGTGIGERLGQLGGKAVHVPTPAGLLRGAVVQHAGRSVFLVRRHSGGHKVPPHKVNYTAIALGLKTLGVRACLATAAVGSLRQDWTAGTMAVMSDFIDLTGRNLTLFSRSVVHTDFTAPFGPGARAALLKAGRDLGHPLQEKCVYLCGNGPRYETPHEIQLLRNIGHVVGMTSASEAILLREAGIEYAGLAVVTNLAAGISESPLSHEEVVEEMVRSGERAVQILLKAVEEL